MPRIPTPLGSPAPFARASMYLTNAMGNGYSPSGQAGISDGASSSLCASSYAPQPWASSWAGGAYSASALGSLLRPLVRVLCCVVALMAYAHFTTGKPIFPPYHTSEPSSLRLTKCVFVFDISPEKECVSHLLHVSAYAGQQWGKIHFQVHGSGRPHHAMLERSSMHSLFESYCRFPIQLANRKVVPDYYFPGRGVTIVSTLEPNLFHIGYVRYAHARDVNVGPKLLLSSFPSDGHALLRYIYGMPGSIGSLSGFTDSPYQENRSYGREKYKDNRCLKLIFGGTSHTLLGLQILILVIAGVGCAGLSEIGFGRFFDDPNRQRNWQWCLLGIVGFVGCVTFYGWGALGDPRAIWGLCSIFG